MLYVSFVEILPKAHEQIESAINGDHAWWIAVAAFFGGMIFIGLIDRLIPTPQNPHEPRRVSDIEQIKKAPEPAPWAHTPAARAQLHRMGLFTALAIGIHNFPEGLVTFLTALEDPTLGVAIAIAIALHNIPEGVSVAVPIFYATGNRKAAFGWSLLSGLAEPLGAVVGYLALRPFLTPTVMGVLFGAVAGIMVFISLDELLPTSRAFGEGHDSLYGLLLGMVAMALSLLLLLPS
jgi:zinc transporter, ZIP family